MRKIGEGYYYNVYDIGNDRVLKKQKSTIRMFLYILVVNWFLPRSFNEYRVARKNILKIKKVYNIVENQLPKSLIGNPTFLEGIDYEQDKAIPLRKKLGRVSEDEFKLLLEKFISLIKTLWAYGFHEKVYNFTLNNAVTHDGEMILLDFNELTLSRDGIEEDIKRKIWTKRSSFFRLTPRLKAYYKKRMSEEITIENVKQVWNSKKIF